MIRGKNFTIKPVNRRLYGTPWSKLSGVPIDKNVLKDLGKCLVKVIAKEAKKDFAKRGWSGRDPAGGPDIWDSFRYEILGQSTLVIKSSFYGMAELVMGDIPPRKMTWLSQEAKDKQPNRYRRTPMEKKLKMTQSGRVFAGQRRPLIVPIKERSGEVVFRTAPLRTAEAWIHPGIAKFTFFERAIRKGREACIEIIQKAILRRLKQGDPTR